MWLSEWYSRMLTDLDPFNQIDIQIKFLYISKFIKYNLNQLSAN